ncbi:MAG TPA: glycerophosphodiester phosphodiesterase [Blastococcus sp.]|nr:glycerophosphodiester phosphodiesterase [Blastococcus sp.]
MFAHRGATGRGHVENTVPAVEAALAGADGVEIDVRLSADGVPVCSHDETLLRTAGADVTVAETPYGVLRRIRVGGAVAAPGLSEIVATVGNRGRLIVEVKRGPEPPAATARAVGQVLATARPADVVVSSFDPALLQVLAGEQSRLPTALITTADNTSPELPELARRLGCAEVHPHWSATTDRLVRAAHSRDLAVVPWTITEQNQLGRLTSDLDGAIVDISVDPAARAPERG